MGDADFDMGRCARELDRDTVDGLVWWQSLCGDMGRKEVMVVFASNGASAEHRDKPRMLATRDER